MGAGYSLEALLLETVKEGFEILEFSQDLVVLLRFCKRCNHLET